MPENFCYVNEYGVGARGHNATSVVFGYRACQNDIVSAARTGVLFGRTRALVACSKS